MLGTGAVKPKLRGHLTFWMRVDEVITFDEYWQDRRFRRKKPRMSGTTCLRYGDNIYHRDGGKKFQTGRTRSTALKTVAYLLVTSSATPAQRTRC